MPTILTLQQEEKAKLEYTYFSGLNRSEERTEADEETTHSSGQRSTAGSKQEEAI
jgi:hypothetical protein